MVDSKVKTQLTVKDIAIIGIFAAVTVVLAQLAVPLPFTPVPISLSLVAVFAAGILLKPKHAIWSQVCYLMLGAVGLPVFAGFKGGLGALFGSTGGYLIAYPFVSAIVSLTINGHFARQLGKKHDIIWIFVKAAVSMLFALLLLYMGGTLWLSVIADTPFGVALDVAVLPFLVPDAIKIVFCVIVIVPIRIRMLSLNVLLLD